MNISKHSIVETVIELLSHVLILLMTLKFLSVEAETRAIPHLIYSNLYTKFLKGISCLLAFYLKLIKLLMSVTFSEAWYFHLLNYLVRQSGACYHSFRIFNIVLLLVDIAMILPGCFILAYVPFVTAAK